MPAVTVVTPVYNRPAAVLRAIDSVRAQTFGDWELIVVDDGSTDGTADTVAAHIEGDPRIRLVRLARNGGVSAARNAAIREARGEWIGFLDSDDWWLPPMLERQLARVAEGVAEGKPAPGIVMCWCERMQPDGTCRRDGSADEGFVNDEIVRSEIVVPSTWLVSAEALCRAGLFDESLRAAEDADFLYRLCPSSRVAVVRDVLVMKDERGRDRLSCIARNWESYETNLRRHERMLCRVRGNRRVVGYWTSFAGFHAAGGRRVHGLRAASRALKLAPFDRRAWRAMYVACVLRRVGRAPGGKRHQCLQ